MKTQQIIEPSLLFAGACLSGEKVKTSRKTLAGLTGIFEDTQAYAALASDTPVYEVFSFLPADPPLPGALNFGITKLFPGKVGREYFMTRGHFHARIDCGEYYWGLEGEGVLLLMDGRRVTRGERMFPGSLHYIPGGVAHRVANTGSKPLAFAACWPSDAGHDYDAISSHGFSARVMEIDETLQLVESCTE